MCTNFDLRRDLRKFLSSPHEDFDFAFRPERDNELLAKNGKNVFNKKNLSLRHYWDHRFQLFSKLNEGILMDYEGWYSVSPEKIAEHVADRVRFANDDDYLVLDAFTGVGGNAIQFALAGAFVIAVDLDPMKIRCALHNARIYGVANRINFICGDFFDVANSLRANDAPGDDNSSKIDVVYLSPPWGGPKCNSFDRIDLNMLTPDGKKIFDAAKTLCPNIIYYLPRNINIKELVELAASHRFRVEIEQAVLNKRVKAIHAYFGNLFAS